MRYSTCKMSNKIIVFNRILALINRQHFFFLICEAEINKEGEEHYCAQVINFLFIGKEIILEINLDYNS